MKKMRMFLIAAVLFTANNVFAQEKNDTPVQDKGWWIGGEVGFWHTTVDELGINSFVLVPEVGYDFNKRWSIGLGIGYGIVSAETNFGENAKADVFHVSPYARWKYCNTGRVSLFLDGGISAAGGDIDGFKIGIQPGLSVKVGKHIRVQSHLGFLGYCTNYFNDNKDDSEGFGLKFSSSDLKFGVYYSF